MHLQEAGPQQGHADQARAAGHNLTGSALLPQRCLLNMSLCALAQRLNRCFKSVPVKSDGCVTLHWDVIKAPVQNA